MRRRAPPFIEPAWVTPEPVVAVAVGHPPRDARIVGVVVGVETNVDPVLGAERIRNAAEALRAAGLALVLSPEELTVKTRRRRWWHRNTNRGGSP